MHQKSLDEYIADCWFISTEMGIVKGKTDKDYKEFKSKYSEYLKKAWDNGISVETCIKVYL